MPRRQKTFSIDLSPMQKEGQNGEKSTVAPLEVNASKEEAVSASEASSTKGTTRKKASKRSSKRASIQPDLLSTDQVLSATGSASCDSNDLGNVSQQVDSGVDVVAIESDGVVRSAEGEDPIAWEPEAVTEIVHSPSQEGPRSDGVEQGEGLTSLIPTENSRVALELVSDKAEDETAEVSDVYEEKATQGGSSRHKTRRVPRVLVANPVSKMIGHWYDRLSGAVSSGTLSGVEEEYSSGHTGRDFLWNTIGVGTWGMVFPLLTIVVTRLVGVEQAGMFSLAFITGLMLMFVANYGVRTFQVSDVSEEYSFQEYQINRVITCIIMVVVGVGYLWIRGYESDMLIISAGVYAYKLIDGLADVYEGRLQQVDKLYLAGVSQALRSIVAVAVFSLVLFVSLNLPAACVAMAIAATVTFVVVTYPLALFETPRSKGVKVAHLWSLLKLCFPLFIALFMYNLIDNMPKFLMEGRLAYENQLYFNALYFPAHSILLIAGFVYKPLLLRMAQQWADPDQRKKFDWTIVGIMGVIVVLTFAMMGIMGWIGLPIMSFLYGLDFGQFKGLCFIMLAAGGVTAAIEFIYQVITVLRRQNQLMRSYIIAFGFSLFVPILLIEFTGLPGAVIGYLIVMTILFVLLMSEYVSIRLEFTHQSIEEVYKAGTYEYYQYLYEDQKNQESVQSQEAGSGEIVPASQESMSEEAKKESKTCETTCSSADDAEPLPGDDKPVSALDSSTPSSDKESRASSKRSSSRRRSRSSKDTQ